MMTNLLTRQSVRLVHGLIHGPILMMMRCSALTVSRMSHAYLSWTPAKPACTTTCTACTTSAAAAAAAAELSICDVGDNNQRHDPLLGCLDTVYLLQKPTQGPRMYMQNTWQTQPCCTAARNESTIEGHAYAVCSQEEYVHTIHMDQCLPDAAAPDEDMLKMGYSAVLQEPRTVTLQRMQDMTDSKHAASTFAVAVMFFSWQFQLSSASCNSPL